MQIGDIALWRRRSVLASIAIVAAAILHILATFVSPMLAGGDAFMRLSRNLPTNRFVVLPVAKPGAQVLPMQSPVNELSICEFDTTEGPVLIQATLPETGWTFSIYSQTGDGLYTLTGQPDRRTEASVVVMPPGDRFLGSIGEMQAGAVDLVQVAAPTGRGLAVLSAPVRGRGYGGELDQEIARASCRQQKF